MLVPRITLQIILWLLVQFPAYPHFRVCLVSLIILQTCWYHHHCLQILIFHISIEEGISEKFFEVFWHCTLLFFLKLNWRELLSPLPRFLPTKDKAQNSTGKVDRGDVINLTEGKFLRKNPRSWKFSPPKGTLEDQENLLNLLWLLILED